MRMREILLNSAKYPLSNLKSLFSLGVMILIGSFLLSRYFDFNELFGYHLNITSSVIIIVLTLLVLIVTSVLESGYTFRIIEKSLMGIGKPPELNNFISMFKHGINEIVIATIYFIVPVLIFLIVLDTVVTQINFGLPSISENVIVMLVILLIFLLFISEMLFTVAIPHMAFKGGGFKEAFKLHEIFKEIKEIGFKRLLIGYLIVVLGIVAVGWPILEEVIESANIIGFIIAELIIAPYLLVFSARFTALIYKARPSN